MRLTNTLVSGTISARNGGFAVAPYLCRDYYSGDERTDLQKAKVTPYLCRDYYSDDHGDAQLSQLLHLTYAGIITP